MSTVVSHKTILTLANGVLKTSNAVDELSVFLKTRLSAKQTKGND